MPLRPLLLIVAFAASSTLVAGCTSDDSSDAASSTTASAAGTSTTEAVFETIPGTLETTAPPATAPPAVAAFPTPTAAGAALYSAWTKGDRAGAGALGLAPAAELDKLFITPALASAKNRGCDDGEFGSASCFFGNGEGGVNVTLSPGAGGWVVATIDPFA